MSNHEMEDFRLDIERRLGKIQGGLDVNNALVGELTKDVSRLLDTMEKQQSRIQALELSVGKILALGGAAGTACSMLVTVLSKVFIG